jgi:ferredoxin--NADP+ reductase
MNRIIKKEILAPNIKLIELEAPLIAASAKPGQFVVIRIDEKGERIPLTIADKNVKTGTITIVFQEAGASTKLLGALNNGDSVLNLLGPLGQPTHIEKFGHVVVIGGGVGIAEIHPIIKGMREAGNRVTTIIGARRKDLLILDKIISDTSDVLHITTDDGSCGRKGFVSDILKEMIENGKPIDLVYAVGPVPMMEVVAGVTRGHNIKTLVSLNPLMLDATGMCGVCRVVVGGKTMFACVDGPEFDAHLVDFADLKARLAMFKDEEKKALEKVDHECKLGK